ncbi:MAG: hypothetical protein LBG21_02750 [Campylobacteraceae bacterium]|jgi:hypothetical protein|nr:hypothetical protein [Campylobacteraceae bacterium]
MKKISYKPLLDRFNIPRPTLIEWEKLPKNDDKNWRAKHIEYLREQIDVENQTKEELKKRVIFPSELFLLCSHLFLLSIKSIIPKYEFKKSFKEFLLNPKKSVEYQHDFAKRIWKDDKDNRYDDYQKIMLLVDELTSFQYYLLIRLCLQFNTKFFNNENLTCSKGLDGKTWQELHTYDKEFSLRKIEDFFRKEEIIF